ncbi:MAG TPA: tripartite tricarboxylate transporter substrate-binding protein [Usitatibacter sp.]|jgi:tripartite-type tricarboxylate transporter receptor subunit TctC|nr:tripartite tricarboxylate transporter substrate-binding protein [Usitatibacter sp.]
MKDEGRNMKAITTAVAAAMMAAALGAAAGPYPDHPVSWVVPFAPGGATDTLGRVFAERMARGAAQTITVENIPGAGGTSGAARVARAQPDGYAFLVGHVGYMAAAPSLYKDLPYDPVRDFEAVVRLPDTPMVLICGPRLGQRDIRELIEYARAHPGKLDFANAGVGSAGHLVAALFESAVKADIANVPYKGNAPAMTDILGGRVDCMFDQSNTALPQVRGGKVAALAVTSRERIPQLPDVPTLQESGLPGFEAATWYGIYAPHGTAPQAVQWMVDRFDDAMKDRAFTDSLVQQGYVMVPPPERGPAALASQTRREVERWRKVIAAAHIVAN